MHMVDSHHTTQGNGFWGFDSREVIVGGQLQIRNSLRHAKARGFKAMVILVCGTIYISAVDTELSTAPVHNNGCKRPNI